MTKYPLFRHFEQSDGPRLCAGPGRGREEVWKGRWYVSYAEPLYTLLPPPVSLSNPYWGRKRNRGWVGNRWQGAR